jgi:ribosomal protein L11 methyltransferase
MAKNSQVRPDRKRKTPAVTTWFEIGIPAHAERVDLVTGALAELGVSGTEVREPRPGAAEVVFYVEAASAAQARKAADTLVSRLPALENLDVEVRAGVTSDVWTENWRQHFSPVRIGRNLTIVPPWENAVDANRVTIVVNPGGAFGTGRHETTWLCLEALEDFVRPGLRVADVGCGSGILAIAAAKLGATSVMATDTDPAAVDATRENAEANRVGDRIETLLASTPPASTAPFDVIVANIYSDTLVAISKDLATLTAPQGIIVLSGIETTRSAEVEAAFVACGFALDEKRVRGEWAALVFGRSRA